MSGYGAAAGQISDKVTAPVIRQTIKRGHGNM
jgi:hypothetical protein